MLNNENINDELEVYANLSGSVYLELHKDVFDATHDHTFENFDRYTIYCLLSFVNKLHDPAFVEEYC